MASRNFLKQKKIETLRQRAEQQAALKKIADGTAHPSIAQLILERMGKLGNLLQVDNVTKHVVLTPPSINIKDMPVANKNANKDWPEKWPQCPSTCDVAEWRRALEHKEYYELKAIEDNGNKPWFQYPRHPWQYSEFVYCTPAMMQSLLAHMPINRPCKQAWVDAIARDVLNERWLQTHESIAVNKLGNMHDGQHRARGIIKADRGWPIYVTWNVAPEAIYVTDSGDKRKINEKLGLLFPENKITHKTAALCRAMMWGLTNRGIRYSESEIAEFSVKHHQVIIWLVSNLRSYRADLQAVIGKALLWWGEDIVGPFVWRMKKINFLQNDDPAKALYLWLQRAKQGSYSNPIVYYKKALAAIYATVQNKGAKKIYQKQNDIFEWAEEWTVPDGSPCNNKCITGWWDKKEEAELGIATENLETEVAN